MLKGFSMGYDLRFDPGYIEELAERYTSSQNEAERQAETRIEELAPTIRKNGYYTKSQFLELCYWKTPRSRPRCVANDEDFIREVTSLALSTENERLRIEALTLFDGVGWPTASVLLHYGHAQDYPILDVRALWSLSIQGPNGDYKVSFWWDYVQICRELKEKYGTTMRLLDRALFRYSEENQRKLS
jgi:hypothetical protein